MQGKEIIHLSNGMHVSISSRGFPLPAFQKLRVYTEAAHGEPGDDHGIVLTLPNGTSVGCGDDTITILRYPGRPKQLNKGVHNAELSDGTRVEFGENKILLSLRDGTTLALDLSANAAEFVGGVVQKVDLSHILEDLLIGLLLMVHFAVCTERTQTSGELPKISNG